MPVRVENADVLWLRDLPFCCLPQSRTQDINELRSSVEKAKNDTVSHLARCHCTHHGLASTGRRYLMHGSRVRWCCSLSVIYLHACSRVTSCCSVRRSSRSSPSSVPSPPSPSRYHASCRWAPAGSSGSGVAGDGGRSSPRRAHGVADSGPVADGALAGSEWACHAVTSTVGCPRAGAGAGVGLCAWGCKPTITETTGVRGTTSDVSASGCKTCVRCEH